MSAMTQELTDQKLVLRRMRIADLDDVMETERDSFSSPWAHEHFLNETANYYNSKPLVLVYDNAIAGYVVMWFVADECHLANIAVRRQMRSRGFGSRLLQAVISEARERRSSYVYLEVRESNREAIRLYEKFGFEKAGVRKAYYRDKGKQENAILMTYFLTGSDHELV